MTPPSPKRLDTRIRFRQLEMIRAIAETGSVRNAATALHLSAPAVSKALSDVEDTLGFALFTRLPRGMAATPRGEKILSHARLLLNELDYLVSDAITGEGVNSGLLRLGASPYVSNRVLPALLTQFRQRQGATQRTAIQIQEGRLKAMLEQLLAGELDAVLTLYTLDDLSGLDTAPLTIDILRSDPLVVLAPPALWPNRERAATWGELAGLPWILPPYTTQLRRTVDGMFLHASRQPPEPAIEGANLDVNVRLAANGLGLTVAPQGLATDPVAQGLLWPVAVSPAMPNASLALIYRRVSASFLHGLQDLKAAAASL